MCGWALGAFGGTPRADLRRTRGGARGHDYRPGALQFAGSGPLRTARHTRLLRTLACCVCLPPLLPFQWR
eukprot:14443732-Alexandrium_andersonii.AAC.1